MGRPAGGINPSCRGIPFLPEIPCPRCGGGSGEMTYDLLIQGGRVIDPAESRDAVLDVAISKGRIASVADHIPAAGFGRVMDAAGLLVLPGLIDLHAHVFRDFTYWGVDPD